MGNEKIGKNSVREVDNVADETSLMKDGPSLSCHAFERLFLKRPVYREC